MVSTQLKDFSSQISSITAEINSLTNITNSLNNDLNNINKELDSLKTNYVELKIYESLNSSLVLLQTKIDSINNIPKKLFKGRNFRTNYIIQGSIFKVSYNEIYEQPNWIEYKVRNVASNFDRSGYDFFSVDSVYTSNIDDYANNVWDKGHLAPAASFSDTEENLSASFSFLNCVLQHYNLNRYEWAQLEGQVRSWSSSSNSDIDVKIDVIFNINHEILATGAHIPSAFKKTLTFSDGTQKCYYFPNEPTNGKDWTEFETICN